MDWENFWKQDRNNKIYLVHAKDNIPFHTVIFPALLSATEENYKLPDYIVSDNYLTIEGEKLSKSKGNYITLRYLLDKYPADSIRYFLLINDPDKKDFNFSWNDFINSHNSELLGKWGNFINRTLAFVNKSFNGKLDASVIDIEVENKLKELFNIVGRDIEEGKIKEGLQCVFNFIGYANKYFDEKKPWILARENPEKCREVLFNCCNIIYNVNTLLKPYLPFTSDRVEQFINSSNTEWKYRALDFLRVDKNLTTLFDRYDKKLIDEEVEKLLELRK